jgi:hypothetical protein
MSEHHTDVHAAIDPDQLEQYPNGVRVQEIELTFTDEQDAPIDARRARELAFELLILAEQAEQAEQLEQAR